MRALSRLSLSTALALQLGFLPISHAYVKMLRVTELKATPTFDAICSGTTDQILGSFL